MTCPWHARLDKAAYASPALVRHLDPRLGFASPRLRWGFQHRGGFAWDWPAGEFEGATWDQAEADWLGAVLAKIAQRGLPAPCSLSLERHVLEQAQTAGLLTYQSSATGGEHRFTLSPAPAFGDGFSGLVQACLYPELLVADEDLDALIQRYSSPPLSTPLEKELFDRLRERFQEPRLALFVVPQQPTGQIIPDAPGNIERPDFTIELPSPREKSCLGLILEADDRTHLGAAQQKIDDARDRRFAAGGFHTERFRTWERDTWEARLDHIAARIQETITPEVIEAAHRFRALPLPQRDRLHDLVALPVLEAQLTVVLAHRIRQHRHARLSIAGPAHHGLDLVIDAVNQRLTTLCHLAGLKEAGRIEWIETEAPSALTLAVTPSDRAWHALARGHAFLSPAPVRHGHVPALLPAKPRPLMIDRQCESAVASLLGDLFRKAQFREGQWPIVARALTRRPVVGLLPTGAGKSLCYQLASLLQPGFTLVVDPLRSLMLDQRHTLRAMGIHRAEAILRRDNASPDEQTRPIREGRCWFAFVAPERLQRQNFLEALTGVVSRLPVAYWVIDEAHCVSEWGHDFRPAYLNVGRRARDYGQRDGGGAGLMALTGTASRHVLTDILKELQITDQTAIIEPKSLDRPEMAFQVLRVENHNRLAGLAEKIRELLDHYRTADSQTAAAGLVFTYFQTRVGTSVEKITHYLQTRLPDGAVEAYAGDEALKEQIQRRFNRDEIPLLVCTHGFGMGIDKPNIRFVVHAMLPRSVEDYYQQAGRAGRDGRPATCVVLFVDEDEVRATALLDTEQTPPPAIDGLLGPMGDHRRSDLVRNLWFITNAFPDSQRDKQCLRQVIHALAINPADTGCIREITPIFPDHMLPSKTRPEDRAKHLEKALYRLSILGLVADYTVSGAITNPKYLVTLTIASPETIRDRLKAYLSQYLMDAEIPRFLPDVVQGDVLSALRQCGDKLIDFLYEAVEKRRRTALGNMLAIARIGADHGPEEFRRQLLAFLEESEFTEPVREIAAGLEPERWFEVLARVRGADDVTKLLGACRRQLQETPDHPGLYLLVGVCCFNSPHPEEGRRHIALAFQGLAERLAPARRVEVANRLQAFGNAWFGAQPLIDNALLNGLLAGDPSSEMLAFCYRHAEPHSEIHYVAVRTLATRLLNALRTPEPVP